MQTIDLCRRLFALLALLAFIGSLPNKVRADDKPAPSGSEKINTTELRQRLNAMREKAEQLDNDGKYEDANRVARRNQGDRRQGFVQQVGLRRPGRR